MNGRGLRRAGHLVLGAVLAAVGLVATSPPAAAAVPVLATQASPSGFPIGVAIFDTATLGQGLNPTGTLTFNLYGPNNPTCSGPPIFTSTVPVAGNGFYQSASHTTTQAGTYQWTAAYSGDANNTPVATACGDPAESVIVARRIPSLSTVASLVSVGGAIHDTATLSNGAGPTGPTGTITFTLFGPNNLTCSGPPIFTSTVPVNGNGSYQSAPFTPPGPGTYQWMANYSGDANNMQVASLCIDPLEQVVVLPGLATPTLVTQASPSVTAGGQISDTAVLSGGVTPTGTLTFSLYGPDNATCTPPAVSTSTRAVTGAATYTSDPFTAVAPGTYRWVASYSGDLLNNPVSTACNDPAETVVVTPPAGPAVPALVTVASPSVPLGGQVTDTATLSGGANPTGTLTFTLFGPNNATCGGTPAFTSTRPVAGNGTYTSDPFVPTAVGTYRWIAGYSGDANNQAVATACNDPAESVVVTSATVPVTITGVASPSVAVGGQLTDTATLAGGQAPTGTFTFRLFGPDDATCSGTAVFQSVRPVTGNTPVASEPFTATAPGTYRWVVSYSGDANNPPVSTACTDPSQTVTVAAQAPGTISVTKTATPASLPAPGGTFTFGVTVTNTGSRPVTITALTDDVYGSLATRGTCTTAVGTVLAPGGAYSCSFTAAFTGAAGASQTDRVVATAVDSSNNQATAADTATVAITGTAPAIVVDKAATPATLPEPGGTFTFSVRVTNTASQAVAVTSLVDNVHGNLAGRGTCATGATLAGAGGVYTCSFTATFTGNARATETDTVTATAVDGGGVVATASDTATVALTDVPPAVALTHAVDPAVVPEPGGPVTHTVTLTNTGAEAVTVTSLTDSLLGNVAALAPPASTCGPAVGRVLAPGESFTCSFTGPVTAEGRLTVTDVVTAVVVDDDGTLATAAAPATITLSDVPPRVAVDLGVTPQSRPEPGGTFTYTVTVRNLSNPETVRVTALTSTTHGSLDGRGTCRVGVVLPPTPSPGSVFTCSFVDTFTGMAGDRRTTVVTVTVVDNEGTPATASSAELGGTIVLTAAPVLPAPPAPVPPTAVPPEISLPITTAGAVTPIPKAPGPVALAFTGGPARGAGRLAALLLATGAVLVTAARRRLWKVLEPSPTAARIALFGGPQHRGGGPVRGLGLGLPSPGSNTRRAGGSNTVNPRSRA